MASDALWVVSFKCVVKGYLDGRFDEKEGEDFKILKKISKEARAFRIENEHGQLLGNLTEGPSSGCDLLINT